MTELWASVDRIIARLDLDSVVRHGLGPLGAKRLRDAGAPVPERLVREERAAATLNLVAPVLLARARDAYDGRLLLLKGPDLSRRYPDRARRFGDLDLLAEDAEAAQAALIAAGFRPQEIPWPPLGYDDIRRPHHHLLPLEWPGLALKVEVHRKVGWPEGLVPPSNDRLFAAAVPAKLGVAGLLVAHPHHQAALLAAHTWSDVPMRKLLELVDLLVVLEGEDRRDAARVAAEWGLARPWKATLAAADWLLRDGPEPPFVRIWARYLRGLREPTVLELHLQEWLSPFWVAPPNVAFRRAGTAIVRDLRPWPEQTWGDKYRRVVRAARRPLASESAHSGRDKLGVGRRRR